MTELPAPAGAAAATARRRRSPRRTPLDGMIAVNQVSKFFGSVVAVSDVSFAINGGVTALLGPNGAGKSTLFRMMCGLTPPSRGAVTVLGAEPAHRPRRARPDRPRPAAGRAVRPPQRAEFVTIAAETPRRCAIRTPSPSTRLEQVELTDTGDKRVGEFSKGMRQRVKVATALVNDPEVLILDEPLTGLDPVQRRG